MSLHPHRRELRGLAVYEHAPREPINEKSLAPSPADVSDNASKPRTHAVVDRTVDGMVDNIVLVHGTLDRAAGMLRVARRLRRYQLTRYDRRGYGRSAATGPAQSFDQQLEDLAAVIGDQRVILFGHSYGGVLALALATQRHQGVAAVVSFETPRAWEPWWTPPPSNDLLDKSAAADAGEEFCRSIMGSQTWEALPQATRTARRCEGLAMVTELQHQHVQQYDPRVIEVPVIVGVGELSGPRTQRAAQLTADEAPLGELHVVPEAGHAAPASHPEEMAQLIAHAHTVFAAQDVLRHRDI